MQHAHAASLLRRLPLTSIHESYRSHELPKASSARAFGLVFGAFFALLALMRFLKGGRYAPWLLGVGIVFATVALARPSLLDPLNRKWLVLGSLLHRALSPVVLGIVFFAVVWPIGVIMRLAGKDPMRVKLRRGAKTGDADSYWIIRDKAPGDHFTHPF